MKVVLNTNVLVSGTFWTGYSFEILKLVDIKKIILILSKEIITEYNKTIYSKEIIEKIENKNLIMSEIIKKVIEDAEIVEPAEKLDIIKEDIEDNKILECAVEGDADFIISQDKHLLNLKEYQGIKILTPEEFLASRFKN